MMELYIPQPVMAWKSDWELPPLALENAVEVEKRNSNLYHLQWQIPKALLLSSAKLFWAFWVKNWPQIVYAAS